VEEEDMRFELKVKGSVVKIAFASSKEQFDLGNLTFVDADGDVREDVMKLFLVAVKESPFFKEIECN
jgi:hypothetical protein